MTTPPDDAPPTPEEQRILSECIETAFGLLELVRTTGGDVPAEVPAAYDRLLELTTTHGTAALATVWMVWGKLITLGLGDDTPAARLYPHIDGDPDLRYARNAVTLARQQDGEGMKQLVDAVVRDQNTHRTGACIETTCGFLLMGAYQYGPPTEHEPTHHE